VPDARAGHFGVLFNNTQLFVWGGSTGVARTQTDATMYVLDLNSLVWSTPSVSGAPPSARLGVTACLVKSRIFVQFGVTASGFTTSFYQTLHIFDIVCINLCVALDATCSRLAPHFSSPL
jgi:hypothetical protein